MDYTAKRGRDTLPEFQKHLLDKKLVPEAKVSFFAYWVERFLHYAQRHGITATEYLVKNFESKPIRKDRDVLLVIIDKYVQFPV